MLHLIKTREQRIAAMAAAMLADCLTRRSAGICTAPTQSEARQRAASKRIYRADQSELSAYLGLITPFLNEAITTDPGEPND